MKTRKISMLIVAAALLVMIGYAISFLPATIASAATQPATAAFQPVRVRPWYPLGDAV